MTNLDSNNYLIHNEFQKLFKMFTFLGYQSYSSDLNEPKRSKNINFVLSMIIRFAIITYSTYNFILYGRDRVSYQNFLVTSMQTTSDVFLIILCFVFPKLSLSQRKMNKFFRNINIITTVVKDEFSINVRFSRVRFETIRRYTVCTVVQLITIVLQTIHIKTPPANTTKF